jgi:hypothetical protein
MGWCCCHDHTDLLQEQHPAGLASAGQQRLLLAGLAATLLLLTLQCWWQQLQ